MIPQSLKEGDGHDVTGASHPLPPPMVEAISRKQCETGGKDRRWPNALVTDRQRQLLQGERAKE